MTPCTYRQKLANSDETVIHHLATNSFADFSSPVKGGSMAAALIPNGRPRLPVPRAVAIELIGDVVIDIIGDVATAEIKAIHDGSITLHRASMVRTNAGWRIVPPTLH